MKIEFEGVDLQFSESTRWIQDATGVLDALTSLRYLRDEQQLRAVDGHASINVFLGAVIPAGIDPVLGGSFQLTSFGFLELYPAGGRLFTDAVEGTLTFEQGGFAVNAIAALDQAVAPFQLPFGLTPTNRVTWSLQTDPGSCTGDIGSRIGNYSARGMVTWNEVPEPGTLGLLALGLMGGIVASQRRSTART